MKICARNYKILTPKHDVDDDDDDVDELWYSTIKELICLFFSLFCRRLRFLFVNKNKSIAG